MTVLFGWWWGATDFLNNPAIYNHLLKNRCLSRPLCFLNYNPGRCLKDTFPDIWILSIIVIWDISVRRMIFIKNRGWGDFCEIYENVYVGSAFTEDFARVVIVCEFQILSRIVLAAPLSSIRVLNKTKSLRMRACERNGSLLD